MDLRKPVLLAGTALAGIPGGVLYALVLAGAIDPYLASDILGVCVFTGLCAVLAAPFLPNGAMAGDRWSRVLDLVVIWTTASMVAQLAWELPFSLLHAWIEGATSEDRWAWLWWAYGIADSRYLIADPFIVVMEGFTAMVGGPLEIWLVLQMRRGRWRETAVWTVMLGATQWYGTVLYFGLEAFSGFAHVNTARFLDWGIKVVALNGLWLVLPIVQVAVGMRLLTAGGGAAEARAAS